MLEVKNLTVYYDTVRALDNISLKVVEGQFSVLIGPNGAGKSTALKAICGLVSTRAGDILFQNERINGKQPYQLVQKGLCLVPEGRRVFPTMTVLENLMVVPSRQSGERLWNAWLLPLKVQRQERQIEEKAHWVLDFVGLSHLTDEYSGNLSTGQKKLLELARQIAKERNILLHEGVYAGLGGPSFETPADLRFLRVAGADAVGMSTVPEVTVARHGGQRVLGFSGISNKANLDGSTVTTHEEVMEAGRVITPKMEKIIRGVLRSL